MPVQLAARQPAVDGIRRSRFAVVRNTYGQLRDTSIKTWLDWLPDGEFGTYAKSDHAYFLRLPLEDGTRVESEVLFRALDREEHVALNTLRDGEPQFILHPRCTTLRKGFMGRYQFRRVKVAGAGERYHDEPEKNEFSHPMDALQYVATRVFGGIVRGYREGMEGLKLPPLQYPDHRVYKNGRPYS